MKNMKGALAVSFLSILLCWCGCGKTGFDCLNSTGEITTEERTISPFDSIEINDYVNVFISHDSVTKVTVQAGKNILPGISTEVKNRQLVIHNNNTCNWIRSYNNPINVYISTPDLWKIYYNSSGNLTSLNKLSYDSLMLEVWGGCGTIDLDVDIFQGYFYLQLGTADLHLRGACDIASLSSGDFGLLDARNLHARFLFISSRSSNNCYVYADQELTATIESIGDIYYTGNPKKITTILNGTGKVIPF
ncbi:MAG: head GIN domain-containing protein [bacterium]